MPTLPLAFPHLRRQVLVALAGVFALSLASYGLPLVRLESEKERGVELTKAREQLEATEDVFDALVNMETGVRGFLLTRERQFLEPYEMGKNAIAPSLQRLRSLSFHDPIQRERVRQLQNLATEQLQLSEHLIANPVSQLGLDRQKALMDAKRELIDEVKVEEERERQSILRERERIWRSDKVIAIISALACSLLLYFVARWANRMIESEQAIALSLDNEHKARLLSEELAALKAQVLQTISHEYRTPLTEIRMALESLRNRIEDPKFLPFLDIGVSAVRKLSEVTSDVLELERLYSRKELQFSTIRLDEWCFALAFSLDAGEGRIRILASHSEIRTDKTLLRLALSNLLTNALKYSEGRVLFRAFRDGEAIGEASIAFSILDSGIGIPSQFLEQGLYEPFHRANNVGELPGTGLGLSIAARAISQLGGTIAFKSVLGEGTEVIVTLPVRTSGDSDSMEADSLNL